MSFLSPFWLIALTPWSALVLWLLWGRRPRVEVPFLRLWDGPVAARSDRRRIEVPPWGIRFILLAILLGLLAAAHPIASQPGGQRRAEFSLVVDVGITTSAHGGKDLRYREAAAELVAELQKHYATAAIDLVPVPGVRNPQLDLADISSAITQIQPTALDTSTQVREALAAARTGNQKPIVLISDQTFDLPPGVIQVSPETVVQDVAIVTLAVRPSPRPQVMVRVRNTSSSRSGELKIDSDGQAVSNLIQFPPPGSERDFFIDLPQLGPTITASVITHDDQPANNSAWLVREGLAPTIEAHAALPAELRRMIEIYQRHQPPAADSAKLEVVTDVAQLPDSTSGVIVASPSTRIDFSSVRVAGHAVNEHVDWKQFTGPGIPVANAPPGWLPLVSSGDHVLVAARSEPVRQIWVGFDAPQWSGTTDYVVFWTNVFNWLAGNGSSYVGHALNEWMPEWQNTIAAGRLPGLYQRSDGAVRAFNPPDVRFPPPPHLDWRARLGELSASRATIDFMTPLLLAAIGCVIGAAATWKRPRTAVKATQSRIRQVQATP